MVDRGFAPEFDALIQCIEETPQSRGCIRSRTESLVGHVLDERTFRRHLLRAIDTGCAIETPGGYATPVDNLDSRWPHNGVCKPVFRIKILAMADGSERRLAAFECMDDSGSMWLEYFDAYRAGLAVAPIARFRERRRFRARERALEDSFVSDLGLSPVSPALEAMSC